MLTKRTQILFDEYLWKTLFDLAKKENTSIGELVREAVKDKYEGKDQMQKRDEAIKAIFAFRKKYGKELAKGEDSTAIIRRMRDTRYGSAK